METEDWKAFALFFLAYFSHQASVLVGLLVADAVSVCAGGAASLIISMAVPCLWIILLRRWFSECGEQ